MANKNAVKSLREQYGLTRRAFAEHFGIPVGTVRNWEQGVAMPATYWINLMADVLWYEDLLQKNEIEYQREDHIVMQVGDSYADET